MFQLDINQIRYDVQFRYGEKDFRWKYNEKDKEEEWKTRRCRYTECVITEMSENKIGEDDKGNPIFDDKILIIHQEHCSPQDNFCYERGRKESLKNTLEQLFPSVGDKKARAKIKRIRYEFWMHYFASRIMSQLSTKDNPLHPREWRKVYV